MKKKSLLVLALCLFLLAGCSLNNNTAEQQQKIEQQKRQKTIKHNRQVWNKKVEAAKDVNQPNYDKYLTVVPSGYKDEDMSLAHLKNGNKLLVRAQVINLQPEFGRLWLIETKATIYIDKVISGDKKFQGKTVKTEFSGGLSKAQDYFNTFEGEYVGEDFGVKDSKTIIYHTNPTIPMPKIGQQIVVGLNKYRPETKARKKLYEGYGLTTKNFYVINNPEVTYWVKQQGKFELNNPAFAKKENRGKYPNLVKITKKLNEQS